MVACTASHSQSDVAKKSDLTCMRDAVLKAKTLWPQDDAIRMKMKWVEDQLRNSEQRERSIQSSMLW